MTERTRIEFTVPALPIAQPRAKATTINGQARMYEAASKHPVHAFKSTTRLVASEAYQGPPLTGPLFMEIEFVFARPSSMRWKSKPMPRTWHAKRPDADNLIKAVLDALNGRAFVDDSQFVCIDARKLIADGQEQPHVFVRIGECGLPE